MEPYFPICCRSAIDTLFFSGIFWKEEAIRYARDLGEYTTVMILEVAVTRRIIPLIYGNGGMTPFISCFVLCILVPLALNGVFFGRGWRLQSIVKMVRGMKRSGSR